MIKYVILIPCFNDWECLNLLIPKIDQALKNTNEEVDVLIINDGSTKKNNLVFEKIVPKILAISNNRTDTRIYVRGDRTINYGRVLEVMGMLSGAGFSKVALISEPYKN